MHKSVSADGHEGVSRRGLLALMGTAAGVLASMAHTGKLLRAGSGLAAASPRPHGLSCTSPASFLPLSCLPRPGFTADQCSSAPLLHQRRKRR